MNYKKFGITFIILFLIGIIGITSFVIVIDPNFHYHKPLPFIHYKLMNQRYQNNGIVKNFDYDAIITGTSMTENFKTSELDELFHVNSIKVSLSGSFFKETNDLLATALKSNPNIKYIIRSLDDYALFASKDETGYDIHSYPNYLYNDNLFDDVNYILNKNNVLTSISFLLNKKTTTFDEYTYWSDSMTYGKQKLDSIYTRPEIQEETEMTQEDIVRLKENIQQNVIELAKSYPNVEFYYFYPPNSIYMFDGNYRKGTLNKGLLGEEMVTELLLEYDNIHVFSFLDAHDIINDLDNYKDLIHYSGEINSRILQDMKNGNHELTKDNYKDFYQEMSEYYNNFDYDKLFE